MDIAQLIGVFMEFRSEFINRRVNQENDTHYYTFRQHHIRSVFEKHLSSFNTNETPLLYANTFLLRDMTLKKKGTIPISEVRYSS